METIRNTIMGIEKLVEEVPARCRQLPLSELEFKPSPSKWSKKEILGHLCDSCLHNLQRIVRVQYEIKPFIIYDQDAWVQNQEYQSRKFDDILQYWVALHRQFIHVLNYFPKERLHALIDWGNEVTAQFVISDYLDHQMHHLSQIFPDMAN